MKKACKIAKVLLAAVTVASVMIASGCEGGSGGGGGDFSSFNFCWGGFNGSNAVESGVVISDLSMSGGSLSYAYQTDLSAWGISHNDSGGALICVFVKDNSGNWVGGKIDWISSSRTTRDLENIFHHYCGWDLSNVPNPCEAAMVIVYYDGSKRSNVITTEWTR